MTSPALAQDSPWGRLYRTPGIDIPSGISQAEAVRTGLLVPSVTNVLDVTDKPYLLMWAARLAAETAYDMAATHPDRVAANPRGAVDWAKTASERVRDASADRGTRIHGIIENLILGNDVDIDAEARPYIDNWNRFLDDWQPEFTHAELTMFGSVDLPDGRCLGYAGTADLIGTLPLLDGLRFVGDVKTGKSVHSAAAGQMSALAHTRTASPDGETLIDAPEVDAGFAVHVTANRYAVYPVMDLDGIAWDGFQSLRHAWEWHVHEGVRGKTAALGGIVRPGMPLPIRSGASTR